MISCSITTQQYAPAVVTPLVGTALFQESVCATQDGWELTVTNVSLLQPAVSKRQSCVTTYDIYSFPV